MAKKPAPRPSARAKSDPMAKGISMLKRWREDPSTMVRELWNVIPDKWQDEALRAFPANPRMSLQACAGPGKAQPVDLVIETPDGARRFGDLRPGDTVFAPDGFPTKVTRVHQRGVLPMYRVSFNDGSSTVACGEHLWKVRGRTERRHHKTYEAGKWGCRNEIQCRAHGGVPTPRDGYAILTTEEIISRNNTPDGGRRQFEIPTQGAVFYPAQNLPLDPYVLGVWLGDGAKRTARGSWQDPEIDREIERRGFEVTRVAEGKAAAIKGLAKSLRKAGVFMLGSHDRYVPDAYKRAPEQVRLDILRGLMDTDGTIATDRSMSFDVTSGRLVEDVEWLVRSLGGVARRRKVKKPYYRDRKTGKKIFGRDCHRLTVTMPVCPFLLSRKVARWKKPQDRYLTRYIDSIDPEGAADAMCIEVDHPSRCYLTNDFIVTHNSCLLAWLGWNFLLTRPHCWIGATSITKDNLASGLWTELARWYERSGLLKQWFDMTKTYIASREHPATWKLEARTWAKDADAQAIGNALRGPHAPYIMWLADETGDYPNSILPVLENIFAGSPKEAHIIQAGNPSSLSGPLYHAATVASALWWRKEITADPDVDDRTPRVSIEHARAQIEQYGRDSPWVMINILGKFPPGNLNALITIDEVRAAMNRMYREYELTNSPRILGVDVAREGLDQSIIVKRRGLQMFPLTKHRNIDSIQGAAVTAREWQEFQADACFVDATGGFGAGWIDQLKQLGRQPVGVHFNGSALQADRYINKRSEMALEFCDWIRRGGALPNDDRLLQALTQTTYFHRGDRMMLEPKDDVKRKIGWSPDEMDAAMLTFAAPVMPKDERRRSRIGNAVAGDYDPFRAMETPTPNQGW